MKILFMCVANSARSQIAEGLARKILGPIVEVESAGSHPGKLNLYAIRVMNECGIDISKHFSKSVDNLSPQFIAEINYIITLCAEEVCPIINSPGAKKLHWPFPDPASKETLSDDEFLQRFRTVRDGIEEQIEKFKLENNI